MLAAAVATMVLTPFAVRLAPVLYGWWRERCSRETMDTMNLPAEGLRDHVVIAGYGRVGRFVAQVLHRLGRPFAVVELDPDSAAQARGNGFTVVYGDAAADAVLEAAGIRRARLAILTVPDPVGVQLAVERIRRLNPGVHIVARAGSAEQLEVLGRLGVYEAVQPEMEAGLELVHQALSHLGVGLDVIRRFAEEVRREHYAPIVRGTADDRLLGQMRRTARIVETEWVLLPDGSPVAGRTIGELRVRETTGASVVAVLRGDDVLANPGPDVAFAPGDTVGVIGTAEQRAAFRALAAVSHPLRPR